MDNVLPSVIEAIGQTPLVSLSRITKHLDGKIFAKLENLNPGLSKKDRIARQIIETAEQDGALKAGQSVVELTSGNTGTGLSIVCGVKGYPFTAVMSKGNSEERVRMMEALGATVVLVDQLPESTPGKVSGDDLKLVELETQRIVKQTGAFRADQFQLEANYLAHYHHTAPEILKQSDNTIGAFCDFIGSGGTFIGCAAAFKEYNPQIKCYIVEPTGASVLAGKPLTKPNHVIQGGGYSIKDLKFINYDHIDGYIQISDEEAIESARMLAKEEGIFGGFSSGAHLAAALKLLKGPCKGMTIAMLICDSGLKYLSTNLWESPKKLKNH